MKGIFKIVLLSLTIVLLISSLIIVNIIVGDICNPEGNEIRLFEDSLGREVEVPEYPEKIISMAPAITEILYAVEAEDKLVAVTSYCNYPEETKNKTSIGGFSTPNIEIIVSLEPDLVIGARDDPDIIDQLDYYNITVVILIANSISDIFKNIEDIGWLIDEKEKSKDFLDSLKARMNLITAETSQINNSDKLTCYFEVWETPKVAGAKSFIDDMIKKAGGINIFGDIQEEYPIVSHESVISNNPEVIFITAMGRDYYESNIAERSGYDVVNAVINNRIYICDDDKFTRAGPRIIDALINMTLALYPGILD
ncbi:MAG: helical backbone metal receptor [Promethearchaeota archaeon]